MIDTVKKYLNGLTAEALNNFKKEQPLALETSLFKIEKNSLEDYGDYNTNAAYILAKYLKQSPMQIAEELLPYFEEAKKDYDKNGWIEAIKISQPGFINFTLNSQFIFYLQSSLYSNPSAFWKAGFWGDILKNIGRKVQVEFISANPTGELTIGNGRGGFLGLAIANILSLAGSKVTKEYYVNDMGRQIEKLGASILLAQGKSLDSYQLTIKPEECYRGAFVDNLAADFKASSNETLIAIGQRVSQKILKNIQSVISQKFKIHYDKWLRESDLVKNGYLKKTRIWLKQSGLTYEKDNLTWLKTTAFGDSEDRVIDKPHESGFEGAGTYFLSDIAYHLYKFQKGGYDRVIDIWGADHYTHMQKMLMAVRQMHKDKIIKPQQKLEVILVQLVMLVQNGEEVKMSKRSGNAYTIAELIDEVGYDAAAFYFLEKPPNTHFNFDIDKAKAQSMDNPVYYVEYAGVRIKSLLVKNKQRLSKPQWDILKEREEINLAKKIGEYPDVLREVVLGLEINHLLTYLKELAAAYHNFYNNYQILSSEESLKTGRLAISYNTLKVLEHGLGLLGIVAPEKM
ncbi:MAG: arginine--tRNA ligase [Candidatus Parcubacteria bacterium]|nr:arginine--tRNA ligase [Candidatus Parcubacteria bacterium]